MILQANGVTVRYPAATVNALSEAEFSIGAGELVAVVGPNGGGKTTLVRALLGLAPLAQGTVTLDGKPIQAWRRGELARIVALVPQLEDTPFSWRVGEIVGFGRYARRGPLEAMGADDIAAVDRALERCDVVSLRSRRIETLSGGEWQRVRIARALAQEPQLLVLDEPTASLDLGHEMALFELVSGLVAGGLAALVVTHDLNLASRYAARILLLDGGRVVAAGTPGEVLRAELLSRVFRWPVAVRPLEDGAPQVLALRPGPEQSHYS
jgi:ABC-type cobalamin/Fe3+-siderophores transport system ATPase subunit